MPTFVKVWSILHYWIIILLSFFQHDLHVTLGTWIAALLTVLVHNVFFVILSKFYSSVIHPPYKLFFYSLNRQYINHKLARSKYQIIPWKINKKVFWIQTNKFSCKNSTSSGRASMYFFTIGGRKGGCDLCEKYFLFAFGILPIRSMRWK